jgi:hypothetical protein
MARDVFHTENRWLEPFSCCCASIEGLAVAFSLEENAHKIRGLSYIYRRNAQAEIIRVWLAA